jgi:hypothetical protein
MIYQTDKRMGRNINKYGCLFMSTAFARPYLQGIDWTANELRAKWESAIALRIMSGDVNGDGDYDDPEDLVIQSHGALCKHLGVPLHYIPGHHNPSVVIESDMYAIGEYYNPRTRFHHFVVLDRNKKIVYDPIESGSVTAREGYLKSMRLYTIDKAAL